MRFCITISLVFALLAGAAGGCRRKSQRAANVQSASSNLNEGPIRIITKTEGNTVTVSFDTNSVRNIDYEILDDMVKAQVGTEPNKLQDANKNAEPNLNISKPKNDPNDKIGSNQPPQTALAKFQFSYAAVLTENVSDAGTVNYRKLKIKRADIYNLLDQIKQFDPNEYKATTREDKIAFWINAYNIKMLSTIIDNYPIESNPWSRIFGWSPDDVRYIDKKVGGFEKQKILITNEEFTLEDIEQNILYKQLKEPRAYFTIIHGGISGPPLRNEPYNGKKLYEQLDDQIKKYLSDRVNFRIDPDNRKVWLPAILQGSWYGKYFTEKYGTDKKFKDQRPEIAAVFNCIIKYLSPNDSSYLELKNYTVEFIPYNWKINDQ